MQHEYVLRYTHTRTCIRRLENGMLKTYVHTSYKQTYIYIIWPLLFFPYFSMIFLVPFFRLLFRTIATIHVYKNPLTTIIITKQQLVTFYTYFGSVHEKFIRLEVLDMYIYVISIWTQKWKLRKPTNEKFVNLHQTCIQCLS